jgi:hypothetical protein
MWRTSSDQVQNGPFSPRCDDRGLPQKYLQALLRHVRQARLNLLVPLVKKTVVHHEKQIGGSGTSKRR